MRAQITLRAPDGSHVVLIPGDLIGRTFTAALRLDDPHISEAHAMVSLRGSALFLLALRGRFMVDGKPTNEAELRAGQRIHFSAERTYEVSEVILPSHALAIEAPGLPRQVLTRTCSLQLGPPPSLRPGAHRDAPAVFWWSEETWRVRQQGTDRALLAGETSLIDGLPVTAIRVPLASADRSRTLAGLDMPLRLVARFDSVHILREDLPPVVLTGQLAQLLSELLTIGAPVPWSDVAAVLWPRVTDPLSRRRRWDAASRRLRHRLRESSIRPDLVRASGRGLVEVVLGPADTWVDET